MKYNDHEFDPVTDEERAAREREEELARRIRREVLRVQSGEADEEIRADREREQAEEEARQEEQRPYDKFSDNNNLVLTFNKEKRYTTNLYLPGNRF